LPLVSVSHIDTDPHTAPPPSSPAASHTAPPGD
jgi:hypothetical protein